SDQLGGADVEWAVPDQNIALVKPESANIPNGDVLDRLRQRKDVESVQPNFRYRAELYLDKELAVRDAALESLVLLPTPNPKPATIPEKSPVKADDPSPPAKPELKTPADVIRGPDPLQAQDADLDLANVKAAWDIETGSRDTVVAVIDTGVDYNHEDLAPNMWHDPANIKNIGWDFVDNDAFPYDVTSPINAFTGAGNPGHGTHCAGNVGAAGDNSLGTSGVAKKVSIMALRMLNQDGSGETAAGIKAIDYATQHGARVISASWGSDGASDDDQLLKESIQRAEAKGVLFIAAAGNVSPSDQKNADNDTNAAQRTYPASFDVANIISVAASDQKGRMANFTHFGAKSVHLAAPGEKSFSTVPEVRDPKGYPSGGKYEDSMEIPGLGKAPWDGTSMATPQVAGAAALLISHHPTWTYAQVKNRILQTVRVEPTLTGKVASNGVLDAGAALKD
ncbi:MAG: S8 family serine peptidase, partial [Deltaproteobacteria bacterium]|nr:S8 family serine peptidase [Deltaproteobacteria bacterium]